jgi:putative transport protein
MLDTAWTWFVATLRAYPELMVFLALALGFLVGPLKLKGFALGSVTATLLAGILIGQLGITVEGPIKATFFLLFLFAVGYGVGPQFFQGISKDGPKQIVFSLIVLALCLLVPVACAWMAGLQVGYAAGLYAGSQTISASIGVASDQIQRMGLSAADAKAQADAIPIGYALTYIFGTIGSAVLLAQLGPKLIGVDLPAACAEYERRLGGGAANREPGVLSAYRAIQVRAYTIEFDSDVAGRPARELFPESRIFVERVRRGGRLIDADGDTVLMAGDVAAISGPNKRCSSASSLWCERPATRGCSIFRRQQSMSSSRTRPSTAPRCASSPINPGHAASTCARSRETSSRCRFCPTPRFCAATP